jgi:glycine oxidase
VLVLEPEGLASGSSGHATGSLSMLTSEFTEGAPFDFARRAYDLWGELAPVVEEEAGFEIGFQRRPALRLALEESEEHAVRAAVEWVRHYLPIEWVCADDVRSLEPRLSAEVRGAALQPENATVDSYRATLAFGRAAERHGAVVRQRRLTGLEVRSDRVVGACCDDTVIPCDAVVLAMGPWSGECSPWLGMTVPVVPMKGERLLLRWDEPPLQQFLSSPRRGHLISMLDGTLSVGSTGGRDYDDRAAYQGIEVDSQPTETALMELMQRAVDVLPGLQNAQIVERLAGSRPLSGDLRPIIGPAPGVEGAVLATGHTTKGIHLGPLTGALVADYLVDGQFDATIDLSPFSPARFADDGEPDYMRVGQHAEE